MNGMPPHIAQLVLGHKDITTTMGYKAVYPDEAITSHRAFIARRRALRPPGEYRTPTEPEWQEFLGHFQRRKVELGDCGRAYGTACHHEHACIRCALLRVDPARHGPAEPKYATVSWPGSTKSASTAGSAKSRASRSASRPPTTKSPISNCSRAGAAAPPTWACPASRPAPRIPPASRPSRRGNREL